MRAKHGPVPSIFSHELGKTFQHYYLTGYAAEYCQGWKQKHRMVCLTVQSKTDRGLRSQSALTHRQRLTHSPMFRLGKNRRVLGKEMWMFL